MINSEKNEIINKTLKHEGGFAVDSNGGWVYCGINSNSNANWPGWDKIAQLVNHSKFDYFSPKKEGVYNKIWNDPILTQQVSELASVDYYWNGNHFEDYNDKRVASNLFDQRYAGGMESVMRCAFGTTNKSQAAQIANSLVERALLKVIECREKYANSLKFGQQTPDGDPAGCSEPGSGCKCKTRTNSSGKQYTEYGWNFYRKAHLKRIKEHNADWIAGGSSPSYPNTGNNNIDFQNNSNAVKKVTDPRDGNWFLEHLGSEKSIFDAN